MDGRIRNWADRITADELSGQLAWYSNVLGRECETALSLCVVHMFNHQTHHRGQVHAMLTNSGQNPGDTDLFLMPEEEAWQ